MVAGRRILLAYLVYYAAIGAAFPYLPVFYRGIGLGLAEIGALTALQATVQLLFAPVWGGLADRFPRTRVTLPLAALVATVGATTLFLSPSFTAGVAGLVVLFGGPSGLGAAPRFRALATPRAPRPRPLGGGPGLRSPG